MSNDELIDAVLGNLENEEPIDLNLVKKVEYLSEFGSLWEGIDARPDGRRRGDGRQSSEQAPGRL